MYYSYIANTARCLIIENQLVRHDLSLVNTFWLFPVTTFSFLWLEIALKRICSLTF